MIFVLDRNETVLAILTNNGSPKSCPYYDDLMEESLDTGTSSYEFKVPSNHEATEYLEEGGYIVRNDLDGNLVMFTIMELEEVHGDNGEIYVYAENAGLELLNDYVRPNVLESFDADRIMDFVLRDTRWEPGEVHYLGVHDLTLEYENIVATLQRVATICKGELRFRVEMKNGKVHKRYVDLVERRGNDTKKRFVYGKDIASITRKVDMSEVVTALIGIGSEDTTFKSISSTNPPKPLNQDWVGDEEALQRYGQLGKHLFGTFSYETTEPKTLLKNTWEELQVRKNPKITYELDVALLERLADYEDEAVRIGDTVHVVDETFSPPLYLEARVRNLGTSYSDPSKDKCVLGNFKLKESNINAQMRAIQAKLLRKEATWDQARDALDLAERIDEETQPIREEIQDDSFDNGTGFWSEIIDGKVVPPADGVGIVLPSPDQAESGTNVLSLQGEQVLVSKNAFPVNPTRVYRVSFRVRQTIDPTVSGTSGVFAGVACLNETFTDLTGGIHKFCAVKNEKLTVDKGWQVYTGFITGYGELDTEFAPGTKFVRPIFVVNATDGNGTAEVDYLNFEDVTEVQQLADIVDQVSLQINEDSIVSTVMSSTAYQEQVEALARRDELNNLATKDELTGVQGELSGEMDSKITALRLAEIYATKSEVSQTAEALDFKFSSSGGVNLLKNSVGFSGLDFWTPTLDAGGSISTDQNPELDENGAGSAFIMNGAKIVQEVSTVSQFYTIATKVKKGASGRGYLKVTYDGRSQQIDFYEGVEYVYEPVQMIIEPIGNSITIELYGTGGVQFTSNMVNIGNVALQWQHSAGEVYNTNVLLDQNGIRVMTSGYEGYTLITRDEFSGYAEVDGVMTRVFSLNRDVTEVTKLRAESEIRMSPVKVIPITGVYTGWAFIPD